MPKIVKLSDLSKKEKEKILQQTQKEVEERKAKIEREISFTSKNKSNNNIQLPTAKTTTKTTTKLPIGNIKTVTAPMPAQQSGIKRNVTNNTQKSIKDIANSVAEHQKEKEEKNKFVNKSGLSTMGSDAKIIGSNLLNSAHAGALQFAKTVNMRLDEAENERRETDKKLLETAIKYREEDGEDVSELKSVLNSDRYKEVDSKPNYQEKIEQINIKMAENTKKASNVFSKKIADLSQGLGNNILGAGITAINPIAGTTYFIGSSTGSYYDEAVAKGMNEDDAKLYAGIMGGMEGTTEALLSGQNIKGFKSILEGQTAKDALKAFGIEITENFIQEAVMEPLSELTTKVTGGDQFLKNDYRTVDGWKNLLSDSFSSGVDGALSAILLNGATKGVASATRVVNKLNNGTKPTQTEIQTAIKDSKEAGVNVEQVLQEQLIKSAEKNLIQQNQANQSTQPNNVEPMKSNASKRFQEGLQKFKSGQYNRHDNIVVLDETPQYLYNKGYEYEQPIVINMDKLKTIMKEPKGNFDGKNQHGITMDIVEQLPEAISNPLNVIKNPKYNNRYVIVTSLTDQYGDIVIVPIEMNTKGYIEGIETDVNRLTTTYGKENYDLPKSDNIESYMKQNEDNIVYDIDTYKKSSSTNDNGLQLPLTSNTTTSINNSISQLTKNVKDKSIINNNSMQNLKKNTFPIPEKTMQDAGAPVNNISKKILNPTAISNLATNDANTTPKLPLRNYARGNKESSFLSNITTDAGFLNEDLRHEMAKEDNIRYYKGITNQETLEKAYNSLNKDGENATLNWFNKESKNVTAEDVAKGWILLKQYQDAGDYQSAVEVAKKMREMGTSAGQATQAYNILSRLTPEGMFYYAQSELTEAYNQMVKGKSKEWIDKNASKFDLTAEETQIIIDTMQDVSTMEDGYEKKVKIAEIQKLISDKIPPTVGQSIKAWMRISMLFNTKTQVRNILGNAVILPVNMTSDFISSNIDKAISKKTGVRTTGNTNLKSYGKGFKKGLYESYNDFRKGINTRNIEGNRFEVSEGKSFKDSGIGKALNRVDNILSFALDGGDRGFYEATFTNSINNQLILNNTTEVTQEMIDIATNEALQRTWQDNNAYTSAVLGIRNILNGKIDFAGIHTKGLQYGLGDILIPFAKTPANLTKAIVDYSPVGLVKSITLDARTFKNSLENGQYTPQMQHKLVQNIGKGMAGSFLYILGYALAKAGIASGEADDDKDVKNFMKNSLGISSYSIKIGNKTFTYDWAQPVATPLAIMTNYVKYSKDNPDANIIEKAIKSLNIGTEQLLQQSFMDSLNTVLNGSGTTLENLTQAVLELPARAIPTFSKQIADMVDGTQRTSFEYDKPLKSAINSVTAKIPFVSRTLPVSRDTLGNEIKKYGGDNNIFNVMFNPANVNKGELSKAGEEIYRLYQETGETSVFPITAPYYINSKGEKITMTAEQRSDFQKVTGDYAEKAITELLSNSSYKKLTDEKKAELLKEIISDSNAMAKYEILKIETEEAKKKRELIEKAGTKSYYDYKFKTKDLEKEIEKVEVLANANYSNKIKETIYESTIGKDDSLYSIMKESNIDTTEYLKYKSQKFESNKKDDGTTTGKTISGSKKKKVYEYVNNMYITYNQKLLLLGTQYSLTSAEKTKLAHYINDMNISKKRKMEIYDKISGFTVYKDGRIKW